MSFSELNKSIAETCESLINMHLTRENIELIKLKIAGNIAHYIQDDVLISELTCGCNLSSGSLVLIMSNDLCERIKKASK